MNTVIRRTALGVAAAATLTLAACSSGTTSTPASTTAASTTAASTTAGSTTSAPSAGQTSATATASGAATAMGSQDAVHNDADVMFAQQMIFHHEGAIAMADLAPTRAGSQQVKDLAVKIKAEQNPEIEQMNGWLQDWFAATDMNGTAMSSAGQMSSAMDTNLDGMPGMGQESEMSSSAGAAAASMPGMMSDTQMTELTAATGTEFDTLFLQLMIVHHQGAVEMADTELADGSNPAALALAQSIKTSQTQEIADMQQLLANL